MDNNCCCFATATGLTQETTVDITGTSNILFDNILFYSNINYKYTSNSSNINYKYTSNNLNNNNNEAINNLIYNSNVFSNQILSYINSNSESNHIYFNNYDGNTKINADGILEVYHTSNVLIFGDYSQWYNVEDKITSNIIETNLIKFDFGILQTAISSLSGFISTIQSEVSALEASDLAMATSLVIIEQQIEGINAVISGLDFSLNSLYPLEIIEKNIQLNYNTEQFNLLSSNLNIKSITQNIPSNRPTYTDGILNIMDDNTAYIKYIENGTITFPTNVNVDILLVGAGGNGGAGTYSGGGGAGEVIYKTSYAITAGTYNIQIGQTSSVFTDRTTRIYQGATTLINAKGGGDGGFYDIIQETYFNYYLYKSVVGRVNNTNDYNLNQGTNKIIFSNGTISINGVIDRSYPLITPSPLYWFRFDTNYFLNNLGSVGPIGDLTNVNGVVDTTNYIKGSSSVYLNSFNSAYLSIDGINRNFRTLQSTTGFSISFWTLLKSNNNMSSFIFNIDNGINRTRFISIGKFKQYLQFEVQYDNNYQYLRTDDDLVNLFNNSWYFITINFLTNNDINFYINNELKGTLNFILPNSNYTRFFIGGVQYNYFDGNVDDFRVFPSALTSNEIKQLYLGSIIVNSTPTSGGSGGGSGGLTQSKGLKGVPFDITSKINDGYDFVNDLDAFGNPASEYGGGNGGSALANGNGYTEVITGNNIIVGKGGFGNTEEYYYTETKSDYGDGGDGNGGLGFQGVLIIKIPYEAPQTTFNGYTNWNKINNILTTGPISLSGTKQIGLNYDSSLTLVGNNLSVASASGSKWTQTGNNIYNSILSGNVGIGTANPQQRLHIHTPLTNLNQSIQITDGNTGSLSTDGFIITKASDNNVYIYNNENAEIFMGTNGTRRLRINNNNVGINIDTPNNAYKLEVGGNINCDEIYRSSTSLSTTLATKQDNLTFTQPLYNTTNTIALNYDSTLTKVGDNLSVATATKSKWAKRQSPYPAIDDIYNLNVRNVGIGTDQPGVKLDVNGDFSCRGTCSIIYNDNEMAYFSMINNYPGEYANVSFLFYNYSTTGKIELFNDLHATTPNLLKISNSFGDIMITNGLPNPYIYLKRSNGFIGIGRTNPSYNLDVNGSFKSLSLNTGSLTSGYIDCLGLTTNNVNITVGLGSVYSANLYLNNREIQTHLFNNTGRGHTTYTNFNTPTDFGCHYIAGTTNGPGVNDAGSYYSMTLGLGNEYYSGSPSGNFRLQIAYPRVDTPYPYITTRTMENGTWNGWTKIRAGIADSAITAGTAFQLEPYFNVWHKSRIDDVNRFYFANGGSTNFGTGNGYNFKHATDGTDLLTIYDNGWLKGRFQAVTDNGTDYLGVQVNTTATGGTWHETIKIMYGSFTGFHRLFLEDELFDRTNEDTMNIFKNEFIGRVVVSTGRMKTHKTVRDGENHTWITLNDKDAITIESSHCIVKLSNKKKDKTVVGVIGLNRNNSSPDRIIVNSVGEGAVMVLNCNGNIENGDLLQTSEHLGYAERQDDDIIRNYTIGKCMISCKFELDSPYYESKDLGNGLIAAFLPIFYYCG